MLNVAIEQSTMTMTSFRSARLTRVTFLTGNAPLHSRPTCLHANHLHYHHRDSNNSQLIGQYQHILASTQNCTFGLAKRNPASALSLTLATKCQTIASRDEATDHVQVVLTREAGKNGKLMKILESRGISCIEMPLVETAAGPDADHLPEVLAREGDTFDWICITSPEAATVFTKGWIQAGRPKVHIAVVGEGTARVLRATGDALLTPSFIPSVANAEHFGPELPLRENGTNRVLYPASNKASSALQEGLQARGFDVVRLNTYDTIPVKVLEPEVLQRAQMADVIAIASPSAVKAWVGFAGIEVARRQAVACIGSTSARAAEKLGLESSRIFYPDEPSLENFASSIMNALDCSDLIAAP